MRKLRNAYGLSQSQVATPHAVVDLLWSLVNKRRPFLRRVLDLGAGDGRFSSGGNYEMYEGVEIDPAVIQRKRLVPNIRMHNACVFKFSGTGYDACIGNPPYVRHHDIESPWKETVIEKLKVQTGIKLDGHGNLFLYFMTLALAKSRGDGLVALIVPFEWVSRPSANSLREYLHQQGYEVSVYRFLENIFPEVLTTACITIIDKKKTSGAWHFFNILPDLRITGRQGVSGNSRNILSHEVRGELWARRGLSPGTQKIFTLTEGQRVHLGLRKDDVVPCVTSLRNVPPSLRMLTAAAFRKHFVLAGQRCWLIRTSGCSISARLLDYLNSVPQSLRDTYTCRNQTPWYNYLWMSVPRILFHSAFTEHGPKVLINSVGAQAVGSVYGVDTDQSISLRNLQTFLLKFDFEKRVVPHAKTLKKIEIGQLNSVLSSWLRKHNSGR